MEQYIIALDVGTSSIRTILYDRGGHVLHTCSREYHSHFPKPSWVEQDPFNWQEGSLYVLHKMGLYLAEKGITPAGIAVTSQRSSLIPVDKNGMAMCNAIMWQDKRTIDVCAELEREYGMKALYRKTGLRLNPYFVLPKLKWLKANQPEIFKSAHKFLGVQDYVVYHLTNAYVTDWTQGCRTMLMNIETFQWDAELLKLADVTEDRLCTLVAPGSVAGTLTDAVAAQTGMPKGLPVVISGGDQQNAAVGLGVVRPHVAEANTGTGSFVLTYAEKPAFEENCRVLCQAAAIPGKWVIEAGIFNTGAIFRWFKEQCCADLTASKAPYDLMTSLAAQSAPGARGVMLLPHFEGSAAPYWNPEAKGTFFNLSLGVKQADLLRAILEGIAFEIADNLELIQGLTGRLNEVSVAGGMTRSDLFCHIQADSYCRRTLRYHNPEASSLGACMVAAPALGLYPSFEDAFKGMIGENPDVFEPTEANAAVYKRAMDRKHKLYNALNESGVYGAFMGDV